MDTRYRSLRFAAADRARKGDWFRFENKSSDETDIYIYDEISWWGTSADTFIRDLRDIKAGTINLHLNSPGGDVFDGLAIRTALRQHPATVNVSVDGIAASIASVIATAGDKVTMATGSMMMVHDPWALVVGNAADMRQTADALDKMAESIATTYVEKAGGKPEDWRAAMAAETWYTADEAVAAGLADSVASTAAVKNEFDLSIFRNYRPRGTSDVRDSHESAAVSNVGTSPEPVTASVVRAAADWRIAARHAVAAAELEVIHG